MLKRFIRSKQFIRNSDSGVTLVELLVAIVIASIVLGIGLQVAVYNRRLYLEDQTRNSVNQNLRAAIDIVGTDIKQAGEWIPDRLFPVVTIKSGGSGGLEGSVLTIRRNLLGTPLNVCQQINAKTTTANIVVAVAGGPAGCNPTEVSNNLALWRNYRLTHGSRISAYIYDGNGSGEFFTYDTENSSSSPYTIHANNPNWQNNYNTTSSRIYLLEERCYRLNNNALQLVINDNNCASSNTNYVTLVNALTKFEVQAFVENKDTPITDFPCSGCNWSQLKGIKVDLTSSNPSSDVITTKKNEVKRRISQVFFPRNVLSQ